MTLADDTDRLILLAGLDLRRVAARAEQLRGVVDTSPWGVYLAEDGWLRSDERWQWPRLVMLALRLAPTLAIAEGLLRGEAMPARVLDPRSVRILGVRPDRWVRLLPDGAREEAEDA
jgi:hypothetical protein